MEFWLIDWLAEVNVPVGTIKAILHELDFYSTWDESQTQALLWASGSSAAKAPDSFLSGRDKGTRQLPKWARQMHQTVP